VAWIAQEEEGTGLMRHESMMQAYRILFPYGFLRDDTGHILTAFNRDYDMIPGAIFRFARKPVTFDGIWTNKEGDLYMYNDDPSSRADYFERLGKLVSHKHIILGGIGIGERKWPKDRNPANA